MGNELEKQAAVKHHDFTFTRDENLIGCLSHIINLACQELIIKGLRSSVAPQDGSNLQIMMKEVIMQLLLEISI